MHPDFDINLTGEILPVSLLKCKNALDALKPRELLSVRTDDRVVADDPAGTGLRFRRTGQARIDHQPGTWRVLPAFRRADRRARALDGGAGIRRGRLLSELPHLRKRLPAFRDCAREADGARGREMVCRF